MLPAERRHKVLELLRLRGGFASLPELAGELQVSESTMRRDLDQLESMQEVQRTHGGVFYTGSASGLPYFQASEPSQWDKKQKIAQAAAELVENRDTLLLDGGSTTYELAQVLVDRQLQVVTNSLPVANLFASNAFAHLMVLGGYVYPSIGVTLGPHTLEMLKSVRVRRTFLSVGGIKTEGFYNSNSLLVETERAMIHAADEVIVLADSSKFGHQSLEHLCPLEAVDTLVVDSGISDEWRQRMTQAGVHLIIAE